MEIINTVKQAQQYVQAARAQGKQIGFVPTMGALHQGHLALVQTARQANDLVVTSIYVNPVQFNQLSDFMQYPQTLASDCALLEAAGCDMVFAPLHQEMYPEGTDADLPRLQIGKLGEILEGAFRPGHFQGVALVVAKLFHCVPADRAYFGLKDLQQYMLVRKMAADLFFPVEVIGCPTVRETDGLAMSSRNVRLSTQERKAAPLLYQSLQTARSLLLKGKSLEETKIAAIEMIHQEKLFKLEYFDFVDLSTFKFADNNTSSDRLAACVAAYLGKTRLIDNIPIQP